jgi:hypothetical protein
MATRKIPRRYKKQDVQEFLSELSALAKKYGIAIHGCGHCGSPIVYGLEKGSILPHGFGYADLKINEKTYRYKVGKKWCVWE